MTAMLVPRAESRDRQLSIAEDVRRGLRTFSGREGSSGYAEAFGFGGLASADKVQVRATRSGCGGPARDA